MRKSLLTILAVLVAAVAAPTGASAQGRADDGFTFFGSGFGHGLGMSQWGAYGLSKQGWGASRIVRHYYSGTRLAREDAPPDRIRVGLVQGRSSIRLEAQAGDVDVRLGHPANGEVVATVPSGQTWRVRVANDRYRIVDASGGTVGRFGGPDEPIFAVFEPRGARVRVPEALHTYARGWIEFGLGCAGSCEIRLVLVIPPQEYLYGLGEVPSSWPMAALKAQAIAARTYAFTKVATSGQHRSGCDCALYASSFDQVYAGWDKEAGLDGHRWVEAVDGTEDRVVVDGGQTIQAFYMSSSGGFTEDNENVWGGSPIAYLRGVCDPGDYTSENPSATWEVTYSAGRVTKSLSLGIGTVTGFGKAQRGVSGRIVSVLVRGENGSKAIAGTALRSALGLRDDRVWIDADRNVVGRIRAKYDALHCAPGLPTSRQVSVAGGLRQRFADGAIFFKDGAGAHELHDPVLGAYLDAGGPSGDLGFPTTDVRRLDDGRQRARFEGGAITCGGGRCRVTLA